MACRGLLLTLFLLLAAVISCHALPNAPDEVAEEGKEDGPVGDRGRADGPLILSYDLPELCVASCV